MVIGYKEKEGESRTGFETPLTTKTAEFRMNVKPWATSERRAHLPPLINTFNRGYDEMPALLGECMHCIKGRVLESLFSTPHGKHL